LTGWLGGFSSQGDNATVNITFQDANGNSLGNDHIGPTTELVRKNQTSLIKAEQTGDLPKGTRKILVEVVMVRTEGNYNDGYADDISLTLN
jgi:hypothetical protein